MARARSASCSRCCSTAVLSRDVPLGERHGEGQAGRARRRSRTSSHAIPTPDASRVKTQTGPRGRQAGARDGALGRRSRAASPGIASSVSSRWCCPTTSGWRRISAKAPVPSSSAVAAAAGSRGRHGRRYRLHARRLHLLARRRSRGCCSRLAVVPDLVNVQLQQSTLTKVGAAQRRALHDRRRRAAAGRRAVKSRGLSQPRRDRADRRRLPRPRRPAAGSSLIRPAAREGGRPRHARSRTPTARSTRPARCTLEAKKGAQIRVADLYRLTKAMPDQVDMAGILLELNQVAAGQRHHLRADHALGHRYARSPATSRSRSPSSSRATSTTSPTSSTGCGTSSTFVTARSTRPAACSRSTRSTSPKRRRRPASRRFARIS